jgi:hypothetical protein
MDKRITDLTQIQFSAITANDVLPIVNISTDDTNKITIDQIKNYVNSGVTDTYVTGGTYFTGGTIIFDYNTGSNFEVSGLTEDLNNEIAGLAETDEQTITLNLDTNKIELKEIVAETTGGTRTFQGDFAISGGTLFSDTISATTYQNLPVSGLTEGSNISLTNNSGNYTVAVTGITNPINSYFSAGSGTTVNWNVSGQSTNYEITLTGTTTLNLSNVRNGDFGTIIIRQDGVGGQTITLGTINGSGGTHRVANGGGGSIILTSNASAIDILTFTYNGSIMFWTVGNDYT